MEPSLKVRAIIRICIAFSQKPTWSSSSRTGWLIALVDRHGQDMMESGTENEAKPNECARD